MGGDGGRACLVLAVFVRLHALHAEALFDWRRTPHGKRPLDFVGATGWLRVAVDKADTSGPVQLLTDVMGLPLNCLDSHPNYHAKDRQQRFFTSLTSSPSAQPSACGHRPAILERRGAGTGQVG